MNILPLLVLGLAGCAAPTEQFIQEATECVDNYISPQGVMGKPTGQDRRACWADVNKRMEAEERRKARVERGVKCPPGSVQVKNRDRVGCMRNSELREIFRQQQRVLGRY